MFETKFSKQPEKFLSKCEEELFNRIKKRLNVLKVNSVPSDAKFIGRDKGDKIFRIRIGDFRVLYKIRESKKVILITKIDKRERVYLK